MTFTLFDILILTILSISSLLGLYRGLINITINLLGFIASIFAAIALYTYVRIIFSGYIENELVTSIASGIAFEGLNHAGNTDSNLIVILNDNSIGIDPSVGALKNYLSSVRLDSDKTDNIFESLNFEYFGPVDGHNISGLIEMFNKVKIKKGPKLIHIITKKGKGLKLAEEDQIKYHAPGKFNNKTGVIIKNENYFSIVESKGPTISTILQVLKFRRRGKCTPK